MYDLCLSRKTHLTDSSKAKYSYLRKTVGDFFKSRNATNLTPAQVTTGLMDDFEQYLKTVRGVKSQNYLYKCVDALRETLRFCQKKQVEVNHAALNYPVGKGKPKAIIYVTSEQLARIEAFTHPNASLIRARDLALFQRHTGFGYADMCGFDFGRDTVFDGNRHWIQKPRHKSGEMTLLPLFPEALAILEKYDFRLPKLSNQKYNAYLGTIGDVAGLPFKLTSHILRKTAGMLWLQAGVPYAILSKMLGHANIATTQRHYVQVDRATMEKFFSGG